jgi:hypothetical protein
MYFTAKNVGLKVFSIFLLAFNVTAFWRMPCLSRSGLARVDPLVSFGTLSEHAHAIHGSSGMYPPSAFPIYKHTKYIPSIKTYSFQNTIKARFTLSYQLYLLIVLSPGFSETASWAELVAGDCTSCQVSQDKSAYWTPALYFQDAASGQFELVTQEGGMLA